MRSELNTCISTLLIHKNRENSATPGSLKLQGLVLNDCGHGFPCKASNSGSCSSSWQGSNRGWRNAQAQAIHFAHHHCHHCHLGNFPSLHPPGKVLFDSTWSTVQDLDTVQITERRCWILLQRSRWKLSFPNYSDKKLNLWADAFCGFKKIDVQVNLLLLKMLNWHLVATINLILPNICHGSWATPNDQIMCWQ